MRDRKVAKGEVEEKITENIKGNGGGETGNWKESMWKVEAGKQREIQRTVKRDRKGKSERKGGFLGPGQTRERRREIENERCW